MQLRALIVVVAFAAPSHADTLRVATAPTDVADTGNLRVAIACTSELALPDRGLVVTLDGVPLAPLATNAISNIVLDDNVPVLASIITDVGYTAPPGRHRLRISAPDCATTEQDIELGGTRTTHVEGRLAVSTPALRGTVGAPDGVGLGLGAFTGTRPATTGVETLGELSSSHTADPATARGLWLTASFERRHLAVALDTTLGSGTYRGALTRPNALPMTTPFTGDFMSTSLALRIGARIPLHAVSLAAGTGLGVSVFTTTDTDVDEVALAPFGPTARVFLPLWSSITYKPACNWGFQALATAELASSTTVGFAGGLIYQPSTTCREPAGVVVR